MTTIINKVLAAQEDFSIGLGTEQQNRQNQSVTVKKISLRWLFETVDEITALDVSKYTHVALVNNSAVTNYFYDQASTAPADGVNVLLPEGGVGRWLIQLQSQVTNIAALKAIATDGLLDNTVITVLGYTSEGDQGGGLFFYDSGSTDADDGGTIIEPASSSGRWKRLYNTALNIRWFGAVSDGSDTSAAIIAAIDVASNNDESVYIPTGTYAMVASTLDIDRNLIIFGDGPNRSILTWTKTSGNAIEIGGVNDGFFGASIRDIGLIGPEAANVASPSHSTVGIRINPANSFSPATANGSLVNVFITDFYAAIETNRAFNWSMKDCLLRTAFIAFDSTLNDTVLLDRVSFTNNRTHVDSSTSGGLQFNSCNFNNSALTAGEGYCIDLFQSVAQFNNCYFENPSADGIIGAGLGATENPDSRTAITVHGGEKNGDESFIVLGDQRIGVAITLSPRTENGQLLVHGLGFDTTSPSAANYLVNPTLSLVGQNEVVASQMVRGGLTPDNVATPIKQGGGGGSLITNPGGEGYMILGLTGANNRGPVIAEGLVTDQWYTFIIAARKSVNFGTVNLVNEVSGTGSIIWAVNIATMFGQDLDEEFEWRYLTFKASADQAWLQLNTLDQEIHVKGAMVFEGIHFQPPAVSDRPPVVHGYTEPDNGFFYRGQSIMDKSPVSAAQMGWACSTAGWASSTAWAGTTAYAVDDRVYNGTDVYICRVAGTSAGAGGPTGTGTGITDGSVTWDFVAPRAVFVTMPNFA